MGKHINYECDGQISINDYSLFKADNGYKNFHEHCKWRGWHKEATEEEPAMWMCGYPNGKRAMCWSDWIPCRECNCCLVKK